MKRNMTILHFIKTRQRDSYYWFTKQAYIQVANTSSHAFNQAISRLSKQKRVMHIAKNFYIIVPLEYQEQGIIPTSWFINDLMQHLKVEYYVGLLTAASFLGFAHQQPQLFQIIVKKQQIIADKTNITFVVRRNITNSEFQLQKCNTGYFNIANKETLVLDLVQHSALCGNLNNVATILYEIGAALHAELLATTASAYPKPVMQRLGFLLDFVGHENKSQKLSQLLKTQQIRYNLLATGYQKTNIRNNKWKIIVNEKVELDL